MQAKLTEDLAVGNQRGGVNQEEIIVYKRQEMFAVKIDLFSARLLGSRGS